MDSKTLDILRRARDRPIPADGYAPFASDLGLSPDLADLVRRGFLIASFRSNFPRGYYLYITSLGRDEVENAERRIADSRLTRRIWRGVCRSAAVVATSLMGVSLIVCKDSVEEFFKQRTQKHAEISVPDAIQEEGKSAHRDRLGEERAVVSNELVHGVSSSGSGG
jgi:hypothetical protein